MKGVALPFASGISDKEMKETNMGYRTWFARMTVQNNGWKLSAVGAAALALSGCTGMYDGGIYSGGGYYGDDYYDDGYGYDGYGYDNGGYDPYYDDYRAGYPNIGYGGGWYNDYYYPGYGTYIYDRYGQYWMMNQYYRNYWGSWRNDWNHNHGRGRDRDRNRDGYRDGANPEQIVRGALDKPRQGEAPRMRARPEQINRGTARMVRDGRSANDMERGNNRGTYGNRGYQRTNPNASGTVTQPRQNQNRPTSTAPVTGNSEQPRIRPQMQRRDGGGGFSRRVFEGARQPTTQRQPATQRQQATPQRQERPRAATPAPQQRQPQATPRPSRMERPAPTRSNTPRSNPRREMNNRVQDQ